MTISSYTNEEYQKLSRVAKRLGYGARDGGHWGRKAPDGSESVLWHGKEVSALKRELREMLEDLEFLTPNELKGIRMYETCATVDYEHEGKTLAIERMNEIKRHLVRLAGRERNWEHPDQMQQELSWFMKTEESAEDLAVKFRDIPEVVATVKKRDTTIS